MTDDQRLQRTAVAMVQAAEQGRPVTPLLKRMCPAVHRQITLDRKSRQLLSLWGRSVNFDENAGRIIVHEAILAAIGDLAGVPMRGRFVHAGLQHTYGYLFSLIETPYGRKRDRWVQTTLERGLGVDETLLGVAPGAGTLLANLTWLLGNVVFQGDSKELRVLRANANAVAAELRDYDFARLRPARIIEQASLLGRSHFRLVTDLVQFPRAPRSDSGESTLLIYSVQSNPRSPQRLITAFPVTSVTAAELLKSARTQGTTEVRLRYNAYVRGLFGKSFAGRRSVANV